jgi:formamidopyrimidine-DNA glycosylase
MMPELPEVETCRRALEPLLVGQRFGAYQCSGKRLREHASSDQMAELAGRRIDAVERRAKYLLIRAGREVILVHLGMTGQLFMSPHSVDWIDHEHWRLALSDGVLRYRDPRRFGMLIRCQSAELAAHPRLVALGPEPLGGDWSDEGFVAACKRSSRSIKTLIMDAATVVGVGNIYAAEALFAAGIDPRRQASRVSVQRLVRLKAEIIDVLERALDSGGSTIRNFQSSDGAPGYFAQQLAVYGREHQTCRRCDKTLRLLRLGGRSTVFCPGCQR